MWLAGHQKGHCQTVFATVAGSVKREEEKKKKENPVCNLPHLFPKVPISPRRDQPLSFSLRQKKAASASSKRKKKILKRCYCGYNDWCQGDTVWMFYYSSVEFLHFNEREKPHCLRSLAVFSPLLPGLGKNSAKKKKDIYINIYILCFVLVFFLQTKTPLVRTNEKHLVCQH